MAEVSGLEKGRVVSQLQALTFWPLQRTSTLVLSLVHLPLKFLLVSLV